ncbi:MAG: VOC family protein [Candidatus Cloacimonetes bacterium]|jgi:catechol 2,3-dioxygenase-like lactoylglutathione lyase family enzyme|nr:VOC family protein [Candidatus Cloacimonadota bacterium]
MSFGKLHHIEIYVDDLEKTKGFWSWFLQELGYKEFQKWEEGFSFKLAETYIVFVQTEERFRNIKYHRCRSGLNHLAFHGSSSEFIDELTIKLRARQINILYEDRHPFAGGENVYAVYFEDTDRMKVEVVAEN